jgi:hypothetical protein
MSPHLRDGLALFTSVRVLNHKDYELSAGLPPLQGQIAEFCKAILRKIMRSQSNEQDGRHKIVELTVTLWRLVQ